ncbi:hypothetical protein DY037_05680 [Apilactobacillus micheneri]|uniref:hypothetical protein n=1 Tax=Apilactobacillus micheneri TaxID=1899430 RepID=UPI00112A8598|nr:hypothetical protein [Apilactobacillus micheneri]TPR49272.1 hypothetical protein DY037_05680 [Apilactobacillus micheneri]
MPARRKINHLKKNYDLDNSHHSSDDKDTNNDELSNDNLKQQMSNLSANKIEEDDQTKEKLSKIHFIKNRKIRKNKALKKELSNIPVGLVNNKISNDINPANNKKTIIDRIKESIEENRRLAKENPKNAITNKKVRLSRYAKHSKYKRTVIDLMGYQRLTKDKFNYLVLADSSNHMSGMAEILKIGGAGIGGLSPAMKERIATGFIKFLRMYPDDLTFIALPIPNDTKQQQRIWEKQLNKLVNDLSNGNYDNENQRNQKIKQIQYIKESVMQFKNIEINLINQGFFLVVFQDVSKKTTDVETGELKSVLSQTKLDLHKKVNTAFTLDSQLQSLNLERISLQEKEKLLKRINNPHNII